MNDFRTFLLDLDYRHPTIESNIGHRVVPYNHLEAFVQAVENARSTYMRIDLFFSTEQHDIISNRLPLFENIYFHLYCHEVDVIPHYERLYPQRAYIQILAEDHLWVKISNVILEHDLQRLTINFTLQAHEQYIETSNIVLEEVQAAKLGVQALD